MEASLETKVFLVEDLHPMHVLMQELFASLGGFRVIASARTEAEANLWLDEHAGGWDLVVIDLVLEEGSGMNSIQRARRHGTPGRVVVFSSYATGGVRDHCLKLGADAVFDKTQTGDFIAWLLALAGSAAVAGQLEQVEGRLVGPPPQ